MKIILIDRKSGEEVGDKGFILTTSYHIDEHIIIKGVQYQVGDITHDFDKATTIVNLWREGVPH